VKDNRVLPNGFDKASAPPDVAVHGDAASDASFEGGRDEVRYLVTAPRRGAPFRIEAELWYQPIAYRWAHNLAQADSPESRRFLSYYQPMARVSRVLLGRASAVVSLRDPTAAQRQ
jgi:hypothetical protein